MPCLRDLVRLGVKGNFQEARLIEEAYNLNSPLYLSKIPVTNSLPDTQSYFMVDTTQVILETVKKHEDRDNALILRFYECYGGGTSVNVTINLPFKTASSCNGLEKLTEEGDAMHVDISVEENSIGFDINPFQIISVLFALEGLHIAAGTWISFAAIKSGKFIIMVDFEKLNMTHTNIRRYCLTY
ncbi:hypothetical protein KUTeg_007912 [Tegillarca granosa]|uniref:Glycosyl hydrolases family 38 C-terminal domain-containing protein n=1 Tax=Tegillarca granosa TaxID=220873 RepID=A0ABQ9FIK3_TEGGR|nr:hypothetical protein KUTeg_007912 [Tegillarca granosa]